MMKEAYAQSIECEEPCEGRLSRTVLWEGEGETPLLYSTLSRSKYLIDKKGNIVCKIDEKEEAVLDTRLETLLNE